MPNLTFPRMEQLDPYIISPGFAYLKDRSHVKPKRLFEKVRHEPNDVT